MNEYTLVPDTNQADNVLATVSLPELGGIGKLEYVGIWPTDGSKPQPNQLTLDLSKNGAAVSYVYSLELAGDKTFTATAISGNPPAAYATLTGGFTSSTQGQPPDKIQINGLSSTPSGSSGTPSGSAVFNAAPTSAGAPQTGELFADVQQDATAASQPGYVTSAGTWQIFQDTDNNPLTYKVLTHSGQTGALNLIDTAGSPSGPDAYALQLATTMALPLVYGNGNSAPPTAFEFTDEYNSTAVPVALTWLAQPDTATNAVATFSATIHTGAGSTATLSGQLLDTSGDGQPDTIKGTLGTESFSMPVTLVDTTGDGLPDQARVTESTENFSGRLELDATGSVTGFYIPQDSTTPPVTPPVTTPSTPPTLTLATTARTVDEDLNNSGRLVAFNGEAGPHVVNPSATGSNQLLIQDSDSLHFGGGTLTVSVTSGQMNQLRLGIAGSSGVFWVDASTREIFYASDAQYYGTDVKDTSGTVIHKSFSNAKVGTTSTVIGTLDEVHQGKLGDFLSIHLNDQATAAITQLLAAHIVLGVTDASGALTQNWSAAAGDKVVQFSLTDGPNATAVTASRAMTIKSDPNDDGAVSLGTPPVLTLDTTVLTIDEDLNYRGQRIAFNGEASSNVTAPAAAGTNQLTLVDSDSLSFAGGYLKVSVAADSAGSVAGLKLGVSSYSGVFRIDTIGKLLYSPEARFYGSDVLDDHGQLVHAAGDPAQSGTTWKEIGQLDSSSGGSVFQVNFNAQATPEVVQLLASFVGMVPLDAAGKYTQDWDSVAGNKSVTYTVADGTGATPVTATRTVSIVAHEENGLPSIRLLNTLRYIDEDLNNSGRLIAFNGEAGPNVVNPSGINSNQLVIQDSDSPHFGGGTLTVSVISGQMDQLRLGITSKSGVFKVNTSTGEIAYSSDAQYYGIDSKDTTGNIITAFSNAKIGNVWTVIGTLDEVHQGKLGDFLSIHLNDKATAAITQLLASHIYLAVTDESGALTQNWSDAAGEKLIEFKLTDGQNATAATASRAMMIVSNPKDDIDNSGDDEYTGGNTNDWYDGGEGRDVLQGGAGDDTLHGGSGDDRLDGGSGLGDVAQYGEYSSKQWSVKRIDENGTTKFILTHLETGEQDELTNIEKIWFNDGQKNLAPSFYNTQDSSQWGMNGAEGTDYDDVIDADALRATGNSVARDWINAGAGDDRIDAGAGGDDIQGGTGDDTIDGGDSSLAARLAGAQDSWLLENRASYSGLAKRYHIDAHTDDDGSVTGAVGSTYYTVQDTLAGGDGTDTVFNTDALQFSDKQIRLTPEIWVDREWGWDPNTGQQTQGAVRGVTVRDTQYAGVQGAVPEDGSMTTLFAGSDRLEGNDGNDKLYGGAGGDTLRGDKGNDTLDGGANKAASSDSTPTWDPNGRDGVDVAEYNGKAERYTIARNNDGSFTVTDSKANGDGVDALTHIEVLRFADGEKNLQVVSRAQQNWQWDQATMTNKPTITGYEWEGTGWDDTIDAQAAETAAGKTWADRVRDGAGNDTIKTGGGDDWIELSEGDDRLDAGTGNDAVHYDAAQRRFGISFTEDGDGQRSFTVTDKLPLEFGGTGTDVLSNIERLEFSDGMKQLQVSFNGNSWQNNVEGTDFNDRIDTAALATAQATGGLSLILGEAATASLSVQGLTPTDGQRYVGVLVRTQYAPVPTPGGTSPSPTYEPITHWVNTPSGGANEAVKLVLTAQGGLLVGDYNLSNIYDNNLSIRFYAADAQGQQTGEPLATQLLSLSTSRDWTRAGAGDDRVFSGAGGDQFEDGAGNDFYDGGANGTGQNSWENNDQVHFAGARKRYTVDAMTYAQLNSAVSSANAKDASARSAEELRLIDLKGWIDARYNTSKGNVDARPQDILKVSDKLPEASGGQGVNYMVNMERVQFQDDGVDLGVQVNRWQPDQNWSPETSNWTGNNNIRGGILNDVMDARDDAVGTLSYDTVTTAWQSTTGWFTDRDWMEGGLGNDTMFGGAGADQFQGGKGNDVIDGGDNPALDPQSPWNTWDKYDEARFTNSINRYDIQFYRPYTSADTGKTRYNDLGLASTEGGFVKSVHYAANGFIVVQDRYSDALGGEGRDVLRNVERLTFSDAWEDLSFGYQDTSYQREIWVENQNVTTTVTSRWAGGTRFGDKMVGRVDAENRFDARAGDDHLVGGALKDELEGGQGNDTLDGGANPAVDPSRPWETWDKFDIARYNANRNEFKLLRLTDASGSVTGTAGKTYYEIKHLIPSKLGGLGTDVVFDVERIQFKDQDVQLDVKVDSWSYWDYASNQNVTSAHFFGTLFDDTITGGANQDQVEGNDGRDRIDTGAGDDQVRAGAGDDDVTLGDGNDDANLGTGNDVVRGNAGWDTVNYNDAIARYTITVHNKAADGSMTNGTLVATFNRDAGALVPDTGANGGGLYSNTFGNTFSYDPSNMYVQVVDSLADTHGGEGTDKLAGIEMVAFEGGALLFGDGTATYGQVFSEKFSQTPLAHTPIVPGTFAIKPNTISAGPGNGTGNADSLSMPSDADWQQAGIWDKNMRLLQGWAGNDTLTGGDSDDRLSGGLGNDVLIGGADNTSDRNNYWNAGDVALYHGAVRERFVIESGYVDSSHHFSAARDATHSDPGYRVTDVASLTNKTQSNGTFDLSNGNVNAAMGYGQDVLVGIERIELGDTALQLAPLTNRWQWDGIWWEGYWDPDTNQWANAEWRYPVSRSYVTGTFLNDTLLGGTGGDEMDGQAGNDTIDGGADTTTVLATKYLNGAATDVTRTIAGNEWDMQDVVRYTGSRERYIVKGVLVDPDNYSIIDPLFATGVELFGIQVTDVLSLIDATLTNGSYNLAHSNLSTAVGTGQDLLVNVERVEFNGSQLSIKPQVSEWRDSVSQTTNVNAQGTEFDDVLTGKEGSDWLSGNAGDDTLAGGLGGDELEGGAGNDVITGGADSAPDQWGGIRKDTARYSASIDRFTIDTVTIDNVSWLRVTDNLPSDDAASLGTDLLSGVEQLAFNDRWADISVRESYWDDWQGGRNYNYEGTVFGDLMTGGTTTVNGVTTSNRDFMRGGEGNDVLLGQGNGDELEGGLGNDVLDGGANGSSGESWRDQDRARFSGDSGQYDIQRFSATGTRESGTLSMDGTQVARIDQGTLTWTDSGLDARISDVITRAHAQLDLFDGDHASAWLVVDGLDADMGGEGADLVFNMESINFRNGPLEIDIRADASDWNGDGKLDWVSVQGTGNNDTVTLANMAALTGKTVVQLSATRIDVDLREGNDVFIGGDGGESIRTGMGHDYVDGGDNSTTDQWGGQMRDEVRFEGRFARYNLIDVTLTKSGQDWTLANGKGLAVSASTFTSVGAYSTLVLDDLNTAISNMIANAGDNTNLSGWLVADRLPAEFEGSGVDALVNVEALSFSDKWLPLEMQVWYNRAWDEKDAEGNTKPWEQQSIISAGVDGTSVADTIGHLASRTTGYNYTGDDNLRGNEGNDTINGGAGGDWIHGGEGNDAIDGGSNGMDQWGNARIDTVQYDNEYDRYIIAANADGRVTVTDTDAEGDGTDTLTHVESISFRDRWVRLGVETWVNKDQQTGQVWDVQINGSMLSETIDVSADEHQGIRHVIRGDQGNDSLIGGAGPDEFDGGMGDDTLVGGANGKDAWGNPGFDVARYEGSESRYTLAYSNDGGSSWSATNPGGSNLFVKVTDSLAESDGGLGVDILSGIEALAFWDRFLMLEATRNVKDLDGDGRPDNAELIGTDSADTLTGDRTNDDLDGAKGNDSLDGGEGGDILRGGAGNDSLDGGADGTDREGRTLIDIARYDGNYADYAIATANGAYTVTDNDTSAGGDGVDSLTHIEGIQFADRFVSLSVETHAKDTNHDGLDDQLEIRGLDLASSGDNLAPASGQESLSYRMMGGLGNDILTGGTAEDVFEGGSGADSITGGTGYDRARYSGNYSEYTINSPTSEGGSFTVTYTGNGGDGVDTLAGIEELVFADRKYKVVATGQTALITTLDVDTDGNRKEDSRYITGTDAADTTVGASNLVNIVDGGLGADSLTGGDLGDQFTPGAGNDTISGGANEGLDAAGNASLDRVLYTSVKTAYTVKSVQKAVFTLAGGIEVGDVLSLTVGSATVSRTATSTNLADEAAAFAASIQTAADTSDTVFTAVASTVEGGMRITLTGDDMIFAAAPSVTNGTQTVSGSFAVSNDANQSGTSLKVASTNGLDTGMYVAYAVTNGSGQNATTTGYGPYEITAISGTTLTLAESMGASPAASAVLTVTKDNPNQNPTTLSSVDFDRWIEVAKSGEIDVLRGIEQLVFADGVTDLSFSGTQTASWGASGIVMLDNITGTALADLMLSTTADEVFGGGNGDDHFVIADDNGGDSISDFTAGAGGDVLTLLLGASDTDGINATNADTAAEVLARGTQQGDDTVFDLGQGNSVTLIGVRLTDMVAGNFEIVQTF